MTRGTRRNRSSGFKAKIVPAAPKGDWTLAELAQHFDLHPNQITQWKRQLLERAGDVFGAADKSETVDLKELHAVIGQQAPEIDFLKQRTHQGEIAERREMIDRHPELPIGRQCQILSLSRSTAYYPPQEPSEADLTRMRRIAELHLDFPFAGSRMLRNLKVEWPNHVWTADITGIPMRRGFVYLFAVMDWASRGCCRGACRIR